LINIPDSDDGVFCPEIWQRMFVFQSNDEFIVKPCCFADRSPLNELTIKNSSKIFNTYNQSIKIQQLRQNNLNKQVDSGCAECIRVESTVGSSGRSEALARSKPGQPVVLGTHVDLNLGNLCNLSCAICDPHSSTNWQPLWEKMNGKTWTESPTFRSKGRPVINDPEWFANITTLQLQGGEIFLQPAYVDFFNNLSKHRNLSEISVVIFTNGTLLPSGRLWELLKQCRQVNLFFSIDDIGRRFEYQRRGAKWNEILSNLQWFKENAGPTIYLGFHPTYSLLNIYYLDELCKFFDENFPGWPVHFGPYRSGMGSCSAHQLSDNLRNAIVAKLKPHSQLDFVEKFIQPQENHDLTPFFEYIEKYDRASGQSYAESHPEFWSLLRM
jgi:hypothetical protein